MPEIQIRVRDSATNAEIPRADVGLFVRFNRSGEYSLMRGTTDASGISQFLIPDKDAQIVEFHSLVLCSGYEEWRDFTAWERQ